MACWVALGGSRRLAARQSPNNLPWTSAAAVGLLQASGRPSSSAWGVDVPGRWLGPAPTPALPRLPG